MCRQIEHYILITVAFFLTGNILRAFGRMYHLHCNHSMCDNTYMCACKPWTSFNEQNLLMELVWRRSVKGGKLNYSCYRKWNAINVLWRTAFSLGLLVWLTSSYKKEQSVNLAVIVKKNIKWIVQAVTEKNGSLSLLETVVNIEERNTMYFLVHLHTYKCILLNIYGVCGME